MGQGARDDGKTHLQDRGHGAAGGGYRYRGSWLGSCMGHSADTKTKRRGTSQPGW